MYVQGQKSCLPNVQWCMCVRVRLRLLQRNDEQVTEGNAASDCQPKVDERCDITQVRLASSRQCVNPSTYDCTPACGTNGGSLNINNGRCQCTEYTSPSEICDASCLSEAPYVGGTLNENAQLQVVTEDPVTGATTSEVVPYTVGPSQHTSGTKYTHIVSFTPTGVQGHIVTDPSQTAILQTPIAASAVFVPATSSSRRRLLQSTVLPTNSSFSDVSVPYVSNPVICLEIEDMVVFRVYVNEDDRSLSNFPIYVKDHLYNTNPTFDYGAFSELKFLVEETNVTLWNFAHVFTEAGKYVFADSQEPEREVIISVEPDGSSCSSGESRIQPSAPINLVDYGVGKQDAINEEPDWGLIIGMLAFLAACLVMVVVAVIVWRPRNAGIYPLKMWKPKYRSLGAPPQVPPYLQFCDYDREDVVLGPRGIAEGAESGLALKTGSARELEDFNVRTFYDKLEDQTLFLSTQLAKHQEELRNFYERISKQNEGLKNMLNNLDLSKLEQIEKERRRKAWGDGEQASDSGAGNIISANIRGGNLFKQFIGASARDQELMQALQLLLERINTGKIPITSEILRQAGLGSTTFNIHGKVVTTHSGLSDLPKKQAAERMQLEKDLQEDEDKEIDKLLQEHENKRQEALQRMSSKLAAQLDDDLSQADIDRIMAEHEKELAAVLGRLDSQKQRQLQELRDRLAQRRKQREKSLHDKHVKEAQEAGIPTPEESKVDPDNLLKMHQYTLDTLHAEESSAVTRSKMQQTSELATEQQHKLNDNFTEALESLEKTGVISTEALDELTSEERQFQKANFDRLEKRRAMQMKTLKDRMAKKKRKQLRDLKNKQDAELEKFGPQDDTKAIAECHQQETEALEAELDTEEIQHEKDINANIDEEKTKEVHDGHKRTLQRLSSQFGVDAVLQQQLLDQYRRDAENLDFELSSQKEKQEAELKAKLAARRMRKMKEASKKAEEEALKRLNEDEELQTSKLEAPDLTSGLKSDINMADLSMEEQAVIRDHERVQTEMQTRHAEENEDLLNKMERETSSKETNEAKKAQSEREKLIREKKNKQAAELAARKDLSEDEVARLLEAHARELEELEDRLDNERSRQQLAVRDRLLQRKKRLLSEQKRKQEVEMAQELLAQKKELAEVRSKRVKEEERKAITEGIQEHGVENTERVVQAVLEKRQAQEMKDLDAQFAAERRVAIEAKLAKLLDKYDAKRNNLLQQHEDEMNELLQQNLTNEQLQQKKAELLNKQQLELAELEKNLAEEKRETEEAALQDWELRYARAKLELKEKHYEEYADALKEFLADKSNRSAENALEAAQALEDVKQRLERERQEQEERIKKESEDFMKAEKAKMESEVKSYEQQLDEEAKREKERTEKSIAALNKRKEELLKEKQQKIKEQMDLLKSQGASKEDQDRILEEHQKEVARLTNKMDADRLRMQSGLQERLRKRREEKLKAKQKKVKEDMSESVQVQKEKQREEEGRLKAEEIQRLKAVVDLDYMGADETVQPRSQVAREGESQMVTSMGQDMPTSYSMAAPLSDTELTALLMASPLYKKMEEIRELITKGVHAPQAVGQGEYFMDDLDSKWSSDDKLVPIDLNKLSARNLVVYKFGCFVVELIATHCHHLPVTLLLADKIKPKR
ncbi:trichohyalin-like [Ptychodera flava]|uniref:trichohyalin-like n=1 Tax=Ptychodera flava TaxID=63121 RepID=UPI00396AA5CB